MNFYLDNCKSIITAPQTPNFSSYIKWIVNKFQLANKTSSESTKSNSALMVRDETKNAFTLESERQAHSKISSIGIIVPDTGGNNNNAYPTRESASITQITPLICVPELDSEITTSTYYLSTPPHTT